MSGNGYGFCDSVQAPLTLITAFSRSASSSTFGRSTHGCCGAGGVRGCRIARWSMMNRASGWRSINAAPASTFPQAQYVNRKVVLYGRAQDAVDARVIRLAFRLLRHHDANADRARCLFPLSDDVAHGWIVGIDGLDDREPIGVCPFALCTHNLPVS